MMYPNNSGPQFFPPFDGGPPQQHSPFNPYTAAAGDAYNNAPSNNLPFSYNPHHHPHQQQQQPPPINNLPPSLPPMLPPPRLQCNNDSRGIYKTTTAADRMQHCRSRHLREIIGRGSNATTKAAASTKQQRPRLQCDNDSRGI